MTIRTDNTTMLGGATEQHKYLGALPSDNTTKEFHLGSYEFYEIARFITGLIIYPLTTTIGTITNAVTLAVLTRKPMRTSTNAFLAALAVSDIIKLMNDFLYFIVVLNEKIIQEDNNMFINLYPYCHYLFHQTAAACVWLIVGVASERYLMVCHPLFAKRVCTRRRALLVASGIYIAASVATVPSLFHYKNYHGTVVERELWKELAMFKLSYRWYNNVIIFIIPIPVLIILNVFIIRAVHKTRSNPNLVRRNRITAMLISIIIICIITYVPDMFMSVMNYGYADEKNFTIKGIREITDLLLQVNSLANLFLYSFFNEDFRQELSKICCCIPPVATSQNTQSRDGLNTEENTRLRTVVTRASRDYRAHNEVNGQFGPLLDVEQDFRRGSYSSAR